MQLYVLTKKDFSIRLFLYKPTDIGTAAHLDKRTSQGVNASSKKPKTVPLRNLPRKKQKVAAIR
jgi:hypothetical protein